MKKLFQKLTKEYTMHSVAGEVDFHPLINDHLNAVIKLDVAGKLISYNYAFTKQFGYTENNFKGSILDICIKHDRIEQKQYFEEALLGKTQRFNTLGVCKNGKTIDINVTYIPILKEDGTDVYVVLKNITDLKEQERELELFQQSLNKVEGIGNIGSFHYEMKSGRTFCSKQIRVIFGIGDDEEFSPTYEQLLAFVHLDDHYKLEKAFQEALITKRSSNYECKIIRQDQTIRHVFTQFEVLLDERDQPFRVIGFVQDITNSKIIENKLIETEKQFSQIYNNDDIGIWSVDVLTGKILLCSNGIEQICGYSAKELESKNQWVSLVHPDDLPPYLERNQELSKGNILRYKYRIIHKNGNIRWVQDYTIPTLNASGKLTQLDGLISDITEQELLNDKVKHISYHDYLTNLPNRRMFDEKLQQLSDEFAGSNRKFAVMILDIDHFKYINDTLGHPIGDEVLIQVSERLATIFTSDDMLARIGGDEFGVLIIDIESIENLKKIAEQMMDRLKDPFLINGYELYVTASIGISCFPDDGEFSHELLRNADIALYKAEEYGKNTYKILSSSSSIEAFKTFSLGRDLIKALENNEMIIYYQPRVDTRSGKIVSAEALIRWEHPEWGLVSPGEFLPIAEENGLIHHIDDWVLKEICQQLRKWKDERRCTVPISINISATHFMKHDWLDTIKKIIREAGIRPKDLEFEITESSYLNNEEVVKNTIYSLKEMGIKIALDDFGKGYSSLSSLAQFPFDVIKIDKSFIQNMVHSNQDQFIAKSIIYLAKGLKIMVVAEGVETVQQLKMLKNEECHQLQGYLFSRPIPVKEFEKLLAKKILQPIDPNLKEMQSKRKYYRLNFPYPLAADMTLLSIADHPMQLGKASVLIEDMSIGGLRFLSLLRLPVREDMILQFEVELLDETIKLRGQIVWKEEINDDITEYGIEFMITENEQTILAKLLNTFKILLENRTGLPKYKMVKGDKYQYFRSLTY
ncbi:EAL domain-containing protein [Bacillus sp. FJAT-29790]|uniref:EAL domain-containing protein n=1 Tax=Bacillus sp. FJAT-29790 TaxID=1895002 RepID=UPI001C217A60|nr:EAL domain-containing protein [Bacillus sp. FJAT-29790]MBU8880366.1 EAL domain-containing protein [Bacillus sp. FJAT-29790]